MSEIDRFKKELDPEDESALNGVSHSVPTGMSSPIGQQTNQSAHFGFNVNNGVGHAERCDECGQWFAGIGQLIKHANRHHSGAGIRSKPYSCKHCNKSFANASYLSQHNRIHQGVRPYKCEECTKTFTQLSHLQQHKRTHTGEKPYKCKSPGCTKAFSQLSNLQSHTRSHMTDKPFHCNSCYKCFAQQAELDQHRLEHGRSRLLRTHICKFCGKGYVQIAYLEKHVAKHEHEEHSTNGTASQQPQSSPRNFQNGQRPGSSLSSTPTTTTSVVPALPDTNGGTPGLRQNNMQSPDTPQQPMAGGPYSNNPQLNFYNSSASPLGLPLAQDMDRLPQHGSSPNQLDFFGNAPNNNCNNANPLVPPNVTIASQPPSLTANTLSTFSLPPLNMLPVLSSAVMNDEHAAAAAAAFLHGRHDFNTWQANQGVAAVASGGGLGPSNSYWSPYNGQL